MTDDDRGHGPGDGPGAGYEQVWLDDFRSGRNTDWWSAYHGDPKGLAGTARWNRANLVADPSGTGSLRFETTIGPDGVVESAGTSSARALDAVPALRRPYGTWGFRYRVDADDGSVGHVVLLYRKGGGWPPEIDVVEDGGGDRQSVAATIHWRDPRLPPARQHQQRRLGVLRADFTTWQTVWLTLGPRLVRVEVAGQSVEWDGVRANGVDDSALVFPSEPLWLGVQTHRKRGTPVPATLPTLEVDWVGKWVPRAP
ncbi:hypothetical protein [Kineococcus aurantiacus]|uniref:GH16 domain-containing protein n=1 Tax=Kineococcus aurantiacus TaxID=37633 RepID=A0A7Y9DLS8_9ACTN|nr:hypothetical protein [Kineococcus aurantiacus]NYD22975.1 hypothetical protein [Kineococcus aurantiacus]